MDGYVTIGTKIDTKSFEKQIEEVEYRLKEIDYELSNAKELNLDDRTIKEYELEAEKLINKLRQLKEQQDKIGKYDFSQIGKSIESITKKVGQWALAVFGIRGAYMAVRNAINVISQDDEQLASDIEYMKNALAYTIEPLVRGIVNLMKQLMYYVAYIIKAWTGRDIFASANKSLANANKNAQKLSKTLTRTEFDEMNVLSDTSSSSGGGTATAGMDLSEIQGEVPSWLQWIADNKEIIIGALSGIAFGLLAIKLVDPSTWIVLAIAAIAGLVAFIVANWDKIKDVLLKVGKWIYDNVIKPVGDFFAELWNRIKEIFTPVIDFFKSIFTTVWKNIKIIIDNIAQIFGFLWDKIKEIFKPVVDFFYNTFKEAGKSLKPFIDAVVGLWDKVKGALKTFGTKVGEVIGSAFKSVFNGIMKTIENFLNTPIKAINGLIGVINKVPGIELTKLQTFSLPRLSKGTIVNAPGKGVLTPDGRAIYGEAGPEAYLPLSDTQLLEQLGSTIGRYITINANITNTMNGRVISRELQKVNNNSDFAFNR